MIERIALYCTLGILIDSLGVPSGGWQFWCLLALFWAADWLARQEGENTAAAWYEDALDHAAKGMVEQRELINRYQRQINELEQRVPR